MSIFNKIIEMNHIYPFHMPGHKRQTEYLSFGAEPVLFDTTEVIGTDNLHDPKEIILESQNKCADVFGADQSYYLVNGSTCGIMASIMSCKKENGKIIMARNSHYSALSGLMLSHLEPIYLYPKMNNHFMALSQDPKEIEKLIQENENITAVFITSPTYEGVVSDIKTISSICHQHNIPLIVDEAHGAHFGFHGYFPGSAISLGADIVIQSLHKTLPSFTQTAVLHTKGSMFNERLLKLNLKMLQTSSPSYILMSSMDQCVTLLKDRREEIFNKYVTLLEDYRKKAAEYKNFDLISTDDENSNIFDYDKGKLAFICKKEYDNIEEDLLLKHNIQIEMSNKDFFVLMTSVSDKEQGFKRLHEALTIIDKEIDCLKNKTNENMDIRYPILERKLLPYEAFNLGQTKIKIKDAANKISADFVTPYPPGIPLIVPGEEITKEMIGYLDPKYLNQFIYVV